MTVVSEIFSSGHYKVIERKIAKLINEQDRWLSDEVVESTRATGDSIENIISRHFDKLIEKRYCKSYTSDLSRKNMADFAFDDHKGFYYRVDVKTHRLETKFNMPNLTSVERLSRFYEDDKNYFILLMVSYELQNTDIVVTDVKFVPIEYLDWACLTIGALGWGQIQIANSNNIIIKNNPTEQLG